MTLSKILEPRQVEAENKMETGATKLETKTLEEKNSKSSNSQNLLRKT